MAQLSRRVVMGGGVAALALPAVAQDASWKAVVDRARALDQCHALVVWQNGVEVLAEVFRGPRMDRAVPVKSVSKTVVAALTGAAIDRGEIASVDAPLGDLAPDLIPRAADPRVADLTVAQLVTMQAGLQRTSGANYGDWVSSRDWVANALSRPFVAEPGTRMLYSTGSFHVLGAMLSEVSGKSLLVLARERLGAPLGIEVPAWTRDPQGRYLGGNEMSLRLNDMVRFGEMYRLGGQWDGVRVLSADWVEQSMLPRTRSFFSGLAYGYGWFLGRAAGTDFALARGYGGQIILIAPDVALTVALTSDPTRPARSGGYFGDLMALFEDTLLPTARRTA